MIRRHATVVSAAVLVLVYVALFVALDGAGPALRLGGPLIFGVLAAIGVQVLLGRTPAQISDDAYADDARGKVDVCLDLVRRIGRAGRDLASPRMRDVTGRIAHVVPELLRRVETTSPTSVYSSASQWEGHLTSLLGVVTTYGDVEQHPTFYEDSDHLLTSGEAASRRFLEFALESIRLVNSGDIAAYRANLATVAPPKMPTLGTRQEGDA